jgi:hypothetical protein
MSDEQLAEAGAELIQRYLTLKRRQALISSKMTGWQKMFERLGHQTHMFVHMEIPPELLAYPSVSEFTSAAEDWRNTTKELAVARQQMQNAGLDLS